ncbi:ankyrin repeat domain-containing protein [Trinickia violacea]|uniref:Ankyrin repeat domain-containing protein n=1 Tax=Trinickia violacea TaxID=2571746 RepID=A0A4P8J0T0_9BURK|nr:ankyrin repeat domain-containing protein [Trinickia violacea]QCP54367.1 ankyrin repeat domain-containing protein [Trinickia violacea]
MTASKPAYFSDTGNVEDLLTFIDKNPDLILVPEHGIEGGRTLLHIAASHGRVDVCDLLMNLGIPVNSPAISSGNRLPINEASAHGHSRLVEWLIEHGSMVDGPPVAVTTPLMDSAVAGHKDVAEVLIANGADVNRLHLRYNQTSLDLAFIYRKNDVVGVLENAGGKRAIEPIDFTVERGGGILEHVYERVGQILSSRPSQMFGRYSVELRTALIKEAKDCKLLFSLGTHELSPRVEFFLCLQSDWPLNNACLKENDFLSFPSRLIFELSRQRLEGKIIREGEIIDKTTELANELVWPDGIDAVVVINYQFDHTQRNAGTSGGVTLLALVPLKYPKSGRPDREKLTELVAKLRVSSWKTISIRLPFKRKR